MIYVLSPLQRAGSVFLISWACCRYTYTAEDVQKMIEEKRAKGMSRRNAAAERARLTTLRDQAAENNDYEALEQ